MLRLYIVRHGRTLFNEKHMIQGWCDAPLTKEGIDQAKALNKGLEDINFDACYSSPLYRAVSTARYIIRGKDIPYDMNANLIEFNFGHYEGDNDSKLREIYPVMLGETVEGFDGDTIDGLLKRITTALNEISNKHKDGNVLVVTHSGVITCLLKYLDELNSNLGNGIVDVDNCSVTIIEKDGDTWKIIDRNNTEYLKRGLEK